MTYVMWPSSRWKCLPTLVACANFSFSPFRLFFHCADVLSFWMTSSEVMHPGSSLLLSPFLQKGWMEVGSLGIPLCCFPSVFLSSRSTWSSGRSLWSRVRCTRARFCLLGSFVDWGSRSCSLAADSCYLLCSGWFSLLISARSARCWGGRIFGVFFSVLGCLSRLISARSARWWGGWVCRLPLQLGSFLASRSSAWEAGRVL